MKEASNGSGTLRREVPGGIKLQMLHKRDQTKASCVMGESPKGRESRQEWVSSITKTERKKKRRD